MTLITSKPLKEESPVAKNVELAAKDIIRRDEALGVMRLIVPKGQPIPEGFDATDEERGIKKKVGRPPSKKAEDGSENK